MFNIDCKNFKSISKEIITVIPVKLCLQLAAVLNERNKEFGTTSHER